MLHYGLNIGITFDDLKSRDEKSINTLLENFQKPSKLSNNVNVPKQEYDYPQNAGKKAEIMILPLSIDDETTTSGTASILQNYSKEFGLQCERSSNYIPKDHTTGKFNLSAARERFLFYQGLKYHHEEMKVFRKTLEDNDKHITDEQGEDSSDSVHDSDSEVEVTEGNCKQLNFKEFCAKVEETMKNAMAKLKSCTSGKNLQQSDMILRQRQSEWLLLEDQFKRTCLHLAVEENDLQLAESLLVSGAEINKPEGCGVTPVMIAVIKEQFQMVQLLLKYNAKTDGTFTGLIPPPSELVELIDNPVITVITFGDQKTCSNVRSVRDRAPDEFSTFMEKRGDFHTEGYLTQCCGKMLGPGGFYYVTRLLLGRHQVTSKSLQEIFKEGNLNAT